MKKFETTLSSDEKTSVFICGKWTRDPVMIGELEQPRATASPLPRVRGPFLDTPPTGPYHACFRTGRNRYPLYVRIAFRQAQADAQESARRRRPDQSEEHTSELQSH